MQWRGLLAYLQIPEKRFELIRLIDIIVCPEHIGKQALSETTRAEEKYIIIAFKTWYIASLVYIIIIFETYFLEC